MESTCVAVPDPIKGDAKGTDSSSTICDQEQGQDESEWVILDKNSDFGPVLSNSRNFTSSNIPSWARWMLGSIIFLAIPLYKKIRTAEDEVETTAESVIVVVEKVAEVTEKVAANIANGLPGDGKVKTAALKIEDIAEQVDKDAEKAEAFIRKADEIEGEVDALMEPIIEEGEVIEKEIEENKEADPTTDQSKATSGANDQK
ncbi:uncharacterized protein LOC109711543 [Ananas comosus]|uniref:Uncharacterized protein LOC109711543 n=1 Tax=Ananas comosus TaxID=4615 RepID=A0A199W7K5_ANACO|nr:uncharacterized protein LOC109711543 [Ananas comosus]OAY85304.1 hypothetical protein ACMD2_05665 [Ananas comosus]